MNQCNFINYNSVEKISSRLSECNYKKSNSSKISELQCWEFDEIKKLDKKLTVVNRSDDETELDHPEQSMQIITGPHLWQNLKWESNIIYDQKKFDAINIMELTWELERQSLLPVPNPEIRLRRIRSKKTIFELYPVNVDQNISFLTMDRRFFPLFVPEDNESFLYISEELKSNSLKRMTIKNGEPNVNINNCDISITANTGKIVLYESSEQLSPFRMQTSLTSLLVAYHHDITNNTSQYGVSRILQKKSPFLGNLGAHVPYQLSLENNYFRVPIFEHKTPTTDFLLIYKNGGFSIRRLDTLFLGGKQMPLIIIPNPKSPWFKNVLLNMIVQRFIDDGVIASDVLDPFLLNFDFINFKVDLPKIVVLDAVKKRLELRKSIESWKGMESIDVEDYMMYMAIVSYIASYGYVHADIKRKKAIKQEKKKEYKNASSPWAISKAYINGIFKGFWKLSHFEIPIQSHQMSSYLFMTTLVQKRLIDKTDLRKLTVYEVKKLLDKLMLGDKKMKQGSTRWKLVQELSARAAVEGDDNMLKYARESKSNKRLLRKKYAQQCEDTFENYRLALSNHIYADSDNEVVTSSNINEKNDISMEEFKQSLMKKNEGKLKKPITLPLKQGPENARKLLSDQAKYMVVYRLKDNVVEKSKLQVTEIILEYLRQIKSGKKFKNMRNDILDQNQKKRDLNRRKDRFVKKRLELNLPVDLNSQDTTDKTCSHCKRKGHIRTNQECPYYGKEPPKEEISLPMIAQLKKSSSVTSSPQVKEEKTLEQKSTPISNIQRQYLSTLTSVSKRPIGNNRQKNPTAAKKPRLFKSNSMIHKNRISRKVSQSSTDDEDSEFCIDIPMALVNKFDNNDNKITKEEPSIISPISKPKKPSTFKAKNCKRQKTVGKKKKAQITGCMAPFGDGPVLFDDDEQDRSWLKKECKKEEKMEVDGSDDDDEFVVNIDMKLLENSRAIKTEMNSTNHMTMTTSGDDDSDDLTLTFSADQWNTATDKSDCNNKENIESCGNVVNKSDSDDDDEFIVHF